METTQALISSPIGVLAVLSAIVKVMGNYLAPLTGHLAKLAVGQ